MTETTTLRPIVGRMLAIVSGETDLAFEDVLKYRSMLQQQGHVLPELPLGVVRSPRLPSKPHEPVGTILAAKITGLLGIKAGSGCNCQDLATKMDAWGIAGCERNRTEIVSALVANRDILTAALKEWSSFAGLLSSIAPDSLLRQGAEWLLSNAISEARSAATIPGISEPSARPAPRERIPRAERQAMNHTKKPAKRERPHLSPAEQEAVQQAREKRKKNNHAPMIRSRGRSPYSGWRSEDDGPMMKMGPFESKIRHLTYFVYPKSLESWQWNLEQIAQRWSLFNGVRVLGITHDSKSSTPDAVIDFANRLGMNFDHALVKPNVEKLREVVLFSDMLRLLNPATAGEDEVVFSSHAKGQKYDNPKHTRDWCDLMYRSCLDDWPSVYNALRTAVFAGSFREYGLLGKWHDWAYSGTFYWFRLAEIGRRNWSHVDQWFAGTESWPSKLCEANETACLFLNDSQRLYDHGYWRKTVWPEWEKYMEKINGG